MLTAEHCSHIHKVHLRRGRLRCIMPALTWATLLVAWPILSLETLSMLEAFLNPRSIAVIGASREGGKLGHAVLKSLIDSGFPGDIYPINPKADEILGLKAYASVFACPGSVDLAVVLVPAKLVPAVMKECGQKGVKGVIVISAGFREVGAEGMRLEHEIAAIARQYGMRMVGPNCLGCLDTITPMNASFAPLMPCRGRIAFMSQSGQ